MNHLSLFWCTVYKPRSVQLKSEKFVELEIKISQKKKFLYPSTRMVEMLRNLLYKLTDTLYGWANNIYIHPHLVRATLKSNSLSTS